MPSHFDVLARTAKEGIPVVGCAGLVPQRARWTGLVYTHNLAIGVLVGVLLSGIFFAGKIAQLFRVTSDISPDGRVRTYRVEGQLFYGSVEDFMAAFDFREAPERTWRC